MVCVYVYSCWSVSLGRTASKCVFPGFVMSWFHPYVPSKYLTQLQCHWMIVLYYLHRWNELIYYETGWEDCIFLPSDHVGCCWSSAQIDGGQHIPFCGHHGTFLSYDVIFYKHLYVSDVVYIYIRMWVHSSTVKILKWRCSICTMLFDMHVYWIDGTMICRLFWIRNLYVCCWFWIEVFYRADSVWGFQFSHVSHNYTDN